MKRAQVSSATDFGQVLTTPKVAKSGGTRNTCEVPKSEPCLTIVDVGVTRRSHDPGCRTSTRVLGWSYLAGCQPTPK